MVAAAPRTYDVICFGDEVPGILTLIAAAREYQRQTGRWLRTLLMFKGSSQQGIGGHLVRGGLAYLDRSTVPVEVRRSLGLATFGDPAALYKEFLQRSGVAQIALDPRRADAALRTMLSSAKTDILSGVNLTAVVRQGSQLTGVRTNRGETFLAKQFIDCTVNAELAQLAGVPKYQGFGVFGLPNSELPVTLVFETEGLSIQQLQAAEQTYIQRFCNLQDIEAQQLLRIASGGDTAYAEQLRRNLINAQGKPKLMMVGQDYIDVASPALSIAYHGTHGTKFSLAQSGAILDLGNIAILANGRLSWNALLFMTSGAQAEALARGNAKPTASMLAELVQLERWFQTLGATAVRSAPELYIRHAGNITGVVESLSGAQMLAGGVPSGEALATFGYHLDVRGGIEGLGSRARKHGFTSVSFPTPPLFNVGIHHALVKMVPNLAVISPASGFDGYACAAGRIVEFNVAVGQGVGIAAALAILSRRNLAQITNSEVRRILVQTGQLPRIYGRSNTVDATRLVAFENALRVPIVTA
jgi:hypothetical protein